MWWMALGERVVPPLDGISTAGAHAVAAEAIGDEVRLETDSIQWRANLRVNPDSGGAIAPGRHPSPSGVPVIRCPVLDALFGVSAVPKHFGFVVDTDGCDADAGWPIPLDVKG